MLRFIYVFAADSIPSMGDLFVFCFCVFSLSASSVVVGSMSMSLGSYLFAADSFPSIGDLSVSFFCLFSEVGSEVESVSLGSWSAGASVLFYFISSFIHPVIIARPRGKRMTRNDAMAQR